MFPHIKSTLFILSGKFNVIHVCCVVVVVIGRIVGNYQSLCNITKTMCLNTQLS